MFAPHLSHVLMSMFIHIELFAHVKQLIFHLRTIIIMFVLVYMKTKNIYMNFKLKFFLPFQFSILIHHYLIIVKFSHSTTQMLQAFHGSFTFEIEIWLTSFLALAKTKNSRSNVFLTLQGSVQEITFLCPQPQLTLPQGPNLTG
jgi:hypothetical protein